MERKSEKLNWFRAWGIIVVLLGVGLLALWGCNTHPWAKPPTALEQNFGRAVESNKAMQILNPQAGLDTRPAVGLLPKAAEYSQDRLEKSFKAEQPAGPSILLQMGGGAAGGAPAK